MDSEIVTSSLVYSEVEPFEGWKLRAGRQSDDHGHAVYSEVEPFEEGWIIFLRLRYDYAMKRRRAETITLMRLR